MKKQRKQIADRQRRATHRRLIKNGERKEMQRQFWLPTPVRYYQPRVTYFSRGGMIETFMQRLERDSWT